MKQMYSAGIVTYFQDNDQPLYLLLHYTAGHWDFPKGTMEAGETKPETALRELYEETGLTADLDTRFEADCSYTFLMYDKSIVQKTVYFFTGRTGNQNVTLSHEHTDYKWLSYKETLEQLTYDHSKNILKKAHKYIVSHKE